MAEPHRPDEDVARDLLEPLRDEEPEAPADLPEKTIRKVRASLTARDLVDLTTFVFVLKFCAPLIDLIAAMFGREAPSQQSQDRRREND
jgi:hypothetical protein